MLLLHMQIRHYFNKICDNFYFQICLHNDDFNNNKKKTKKLDVSERHECPRREY
jgi:hypothetical protein